MIALLVRMKAAPGKVDAIEAGLKTMTQMVRAHEPGCRAYVVHRSLDDQDVFVIYEQYDDERALETHRNTEHFRECIAGTVIPLLAERSREDLVVVE